MNKLIILIGCLSIAATYKPCNQKTYDQVYRGILEDSLKDNTKNDRNTSIQTLRKLCRNQKSSWEYENAQTYQLKRVYDTNKQISK